VCCRPNVLRPINVLVFVLYVRARRRHLCLPVYGEVTKCPISPGLLLGFRGLEKRRNVKYRERERKGTGKEEEKEGWK